MLFEMLILSCCLVAIFVNWYYDTQQAAVAAYIRRGIFCECAVYEIIDELVRVAAKNSFFNFTDDVLLMCHLD